MNSIMSVIGYILAVFYSLVPQLGVAIILLTCTVMLLLFPLTAKQTRSMIAMQRVQPEIKKLQQKHKDDKQKQNEEIMRFYQENKINPLSGCLPLLMQMPIFFALFGVLRDIEKHIPTTDRFTELYRDLCGAGIPVADCKAAFSDAKFLGMDLSVAASNATGGFVSTLPYFVLVALVIATGWFQARQTMARQSSAGAAMANTQAQIIGKVMPVVFGVISVNFASGLVVYFVTSNLWRIGQQQLVLNKMYEAAQASPLPTAQPAADESPTDANGDGPDAQAAKAATAKAAAARRRKRKRKR